MRASNALAPMIHCRPELPPPADVFAPLPSMMKDAQDQKNPDKKWLEPGMVQESSDDADNLLLGEERDTVLGSDTNGRDRAASTTVDNGGHGGDLADSERGV